MNLLSVSGFGYSGSGLLVDFFNSSNNITTFPVEFRLLKDADGLLSLKKAFSSESNYMNTDIAIRRFYRFCQVLSRKNNILFGMNYNYYFNNSFMDLVDDFIAEITVDKYWSDAFVFKYHKSDFFQVVWKVLRKFNYKAHFDYRIVPVSFDDFNKAANTFLNTLFNHLVPDNNKYLLIDNGVDVTAIKTNQELLGNTKFIIVGRDPRDSYTDIVNAKDISYNVEQFIFLFKKMRSIFAKSSQGLKNVLYIQYESFLTSFDSEAKKVIEFAKSPQSDCSIEDCVHFNYKPSLKNIGIYKNLHNKSAIRKIEHELSEYLYND